MSRALGRARRNVRHDHEIGGGPAPPWSFNGLGSTKTAFGAAVGIGTVDGDGFDAP